MRTRHVAVALASAAVVVAGLLGIAVLALAAAGGGEQAGVAGIPPRVLAAYRAAEGWCPGLRWQLLAGIGAVESAHGTTGGASVDPGDGTARPFIVGPALHGSSGRARLPAGPRLGRWGASGPWQRALGPMQFLPATFTAWAVDADGDGEAEPHDVDDAVATAANYLCSGRGGAIADERSALRRYNPDERYASAVLAYAAGLDAAGVAITCPVAGPVAFSNTWLAPRPGGRQHQGVDLFAEEGTPVVAPVGGEVDFAHGGLGGIAYRLWGDDASFYYGAHLAAAAGAPGRVAAGAVIGYVGRTGNAAGTPAHLHFEIHPGRRRGDAASPVDPTATVAAACRR